MRRGGFSRGRAGGFRATRKREGQEKKISVEGVAKRRGAGEGEGQEDQV
jgi:hypothetical protein